MTQYLVANGKAYLMANEDDFLTTPEDREWLVETLGEDHVLFHLRGGHIGNLYKPEIQDIVTRPLEALLPVTAE